MTRLLTVSDLWLPFPGGAERLIFNVSREMMRRGMDVEVITGYHPAQQFDGPPLSVMPLDHAADGAEMLREAIAQRSPDVILTHHHYANVFEDVFAGCGIPFVQLVLNGRRLPSAALGVYISRWVMDRLGDARDGDLLLTPPAFDDVVSETHGDAIGFIKPIPHKGVELVYRIAAAMPERRFVILRGEWQDLEVIRPAPNIEFMEPVADIRDFYARCRLVLMPSLSEDAGTVAQECALNGIPCLSTYVGGLVETNPGGLLFAADDPASSWVVWIRKLLDDPVPYAAVAETQRLRLAKADHASTLDLLAQRIKGLAS